MSAQVDTVTVMEVEDAQVEVETGSFHWTDLNELGQEKGDVTMTLSNGRRLVILTEGIFDADDLTEDLNWPEDGMPANVAWEELLQLLDGWRAKRKADGLN